MRYQPHNYQAYCIGRLIAETAVGLFLEPGLGKTSIALTAINDLKYNRFAVSRALVIAPKKVAQGAWSKEAAKWDHLQHLRISLVLGTERQRIRALNTPADVYIINRDNVSWLVEHYRNAWPFDMVVLDESTSFKNPSAKRFKSLKWMRPHMGRVVELTGTPAPRGLMDLWAQVFLLDQGQRLGKSVEGYRQRYYNATKIGAGGMRTDYEIKPDSEQAIWGKIGDICVSMRAEDYLELPELVPVTVPVVLDPKAQEAYKRLERDMLLEVDGETIDASTAAVLTGKLLQLCNGAVYGADGQAVEIHDCKIEALLELIEELNGQPALLLYNYKHDLARIKAVLPKGLRVRELRTPDDQDAWNRGEVDILLAHPQSSAYGLNLQDGGRHIIWFGLQWSLELYIQANGRLYRQGQKNTVFVHHLVVEGGMDEDVMAVLDDRGATQDRLLDALRVRIEAVRANA